MNLSLKKGLRLSIIEQLGQQHFVRTRVNLLLEREPNLLLEKGLALSCEKELLLCD